MKSPLGTTSVAEGEEMFEFFGFGFMPQEVKSFFSLSFGTRPNFCLLRHELNFFVCGIEATGVT